MPASQSLKATRDTPSLIEGMAATPDQLSAAIRDASADALDFAAQGEWSARVVLAHLRDDEFMVMRPRLARMLYEEHPALIPFDEKAWAAKRWTGRDNLDDLLADFRLQREATMLVLQRLAASDWQRSASHPEMGVFDVHWWVQHWLEHDEAHIAQIEDTLELSGR